MINKRFALSVLLLSTFAACYSQGDPGLTVGSKAPALSVYKWMKGNKVGEYKKGKTYLIEFGATWCVPCREAIPHLSALQNKYGDSLSVISLFVMELKKAGKDTSYISTVRKFLKQQDKLINYTVGVDDPKATLEKDWLTAAKLSGIPHAFLIDRNGLIAWIGNPNSTELETIIQMVQDKDYTIDKAVAKSNGKSIFAKVDIHKPLYIDGNGGNLGKFYFRSLLTPYNGEQTGNFDYVYSGYRTLWPAEKQPYPGMVQQVGVPIDKLYYMAYGDTVGNTVFGRDFTSPNWDYFDTITHPLTKDHYGQYWYRAILEVSDPAPFQFDYRTMTNRYNYSLIVPDALASAAFLQKTMQRDLDNYFGYAVTVETRMMPYWKLVATPDAADKLRANTPNEPFKASQINDSLYHNRSAIMKDILIRFLNGFSFTGMSYGVKPAEEAPFIDETGISGLIDYDISQREVEALIYKTRNWQVAIDFLHRLGLDLQKGQRLTKVVVIRDEKIK